MSKHGVFLTIEGIEGVGKSTHLPFIVNLLCQAGREVVQTREPGGTASGESIRTLLLDKDNTDLSDRTELLLIFAARAQHLAEVIEPALAAGRDVVCDRFTDATYAYQGGGRQMDWQLIQGLERWVQQGCRPDLTLLLDAPVELGLRRAGERASADRFESETVAFFERVRTAYLRLAAEQRQRILVVDASGSIEDVQAQIRDILQEHLSC